MYFFVNLRFETNENMKRLFIFYSLILSIFAFISCNTPTPKQQSEDNDTSIMTTDEDDYLTSDPTPIAEEENYQEPETATQEPSTPTTTKKQTSAVPSSGKETLYISTYGANGKVWGHVTMNGNKGHGTIHDDDENSYSITVTRHGGELHGVDQNGRGYVFRM